MDGSATGRAATVVAATVVVALLGGCGDAGPPPASPTVVDLFAPRRMRIHPIFTQVADLDNSGAADGVEAQLEFDDQFDDPTKAAGQVLFELYESRREPPYTGRQVVPPFVASLATAADQRLHWNKTLRTYRFALAYPTVNPAQDYVLTATFEPVGGGRFPVDKRIIPGRHDPKATPTVKGPLGF